MAASRDTQIVLFKAVSESECENDDVYGKTFCSAGFEVILIPVLDFKFVNLNHLSEKLKNHDDYAGIIFTSPRCVTGVELSVGGQRGILDKWRMHRNFAVGDMTGNLAENLGLVVEGKESGNSNKLAEIMSKDLYNKPFLYPKGSLTQDNFKLKLKENNIETDDITIYQTMPHPELKANIRSKLMVKSSIFVYFSPSGVNFTLPILKESDFDLDQIKFVAIGPTTEKALSENGLKVAAKSSKPDPSALLDAVLAIS